MSDDQNKEPKGEEEERQPTGAIVRYTPLEGIVKKEPEREQQLAVASTLSTSDLINQLINQICMSSELEKRLFYEREYGGFFVFPPAILGMEQLYRVRGPSFVYVYFAPYDEQKQQFSILDDSILYTSSSAGGWLNIVNISIPNPAVMKELSLRLPREQYQELVSFYRDLSEKGKVNAVPHYLRRSTPNSPGNLYFISSGRMFSETTFAMYNHFCKDIRVYHNGVPVQGYRQKEDIVHGDIIRIGSSIVFGYIEKGKITTQRTSEESVEKRGGELVVAEPKKEEKKQ